MINILAILPIPYVPRRSCNCCCEDQKPLDIPIEYYIISVILMTVVAIFVYRYISKEVDLDKNDLIFLCTIFSPFILIPGLNSFALLLVAIVVTVSLILSLIMWIIKKLKKITNYEE